MKTVHYQEYLRILQEELVPAMGCTEPIALAYAAARARKILGALPERVLVCASGSIIKNVKSVIVPNTGHMKGIPAACAAGIVAGNADAQLEVLSQVTEAQIARIGEYLQQADIQVVPKEDGFVFDMVVTVWAGEHSASVRIVNQHTNIVREEKDGAVLLDIPVEENAAEHSTERSCLSVEEIWEFVNCLDVADVRELLDHQISCNMAISEAGLQGDFGANVGRTMLSVYGDGVMNRAKAYAAAGSDARMNGCELPVVINSGSGNQGITVTVPVVVYARELGVSDETLYRALTLANLIAIHQKTGIGTLSAYCGAVSAGAAAGAGIAYLQGGSYKDVTHTLVNALAVTSGIVCDGAKASCAAKIASAVDAGIFGYQMYQQGQQFRGGDGIVSKGVENTIRNVGRLGNHGMRGTNEEIIRIMTEQ